MILPHLQCGFFISLIPDVSRPATFYGASSATRKTFRELQNPTLPSLIFVMILVCAIAFAAGVLPAFRASRLNPIEALRYE